MRRLVLALVLVASCARADDPEPLRASGSAYRLYMTLPRAGVVGVYGVRKFSVRAPATLDSAAPAVLPDGVELLDARASFLKSATSRVVNGYPGGICTDLWPPRGLGPTYPVAGLALAKGDVVAITFYLRPKRTGRFDVNGYDVAYHDGDGHPHRVRTTEGNAVEVVALGPGQTSEYLACDPAVGRDDTWLMP